MKRLLLVLFISITVAGCEKRCDTGAVSEGDDIYLRLRKEMVETQIVSRGVKDRKVLDAMLKVERHKFVPEGFRDMAYSDGPLPIGEDQTISQPYIVALMTELLHIESGDKVLEIGTGSGYQAAVLAELTDEVYTIEIIDALARSAAERLKHLGYKNVKVKSGDGYRGWPEFAPFDKIIITAAPPRIPQPLIEQLKIGGIMVLPLGELYQELIVVTKDRDGIKKKSIIPVRFVPMTGEVQSR